MAASTPSLSHQARHMQGHCRTAGWASLDAGAAGQPCGQDVSLAVPWQGASIPHHHDTRNEQSRRTASHGSVAALQLRIYILLQADSAATVHNWFTPLPSVQQGNIFKQAAARSGIDSDAPVHNNTCQKCAQAHAHQSIHYTHPV